MVDFHNEATVATPAADIVRVLILQRRNDLIESIEYYSKTTYASIQGSIAPVRARLLSLFLEIRGLLSRRMDKSYFEKIPSIIEKADYDGLLDLTFKINEILDEVKLTRIDEKRVYDKNRTEEENKVKGL